MKSLYYLAQSIMFQAHQNEGHFSMIHANIYFMFEMPNANYSNNLKNVIIISLMIFLFDLLFRSYIFGKEKKTQKVCSFILDSCFSQKLRQLLGIVGL